MSKKPIVVTLTEEEYEKMRLSLEILLAEMNDNSGREKFDELLSNKETEETMLKIMEEYAKHILETDPETFFEVYEKCNREMGN